MNHFEPLQQLQHFWSRYYKTFFMLNSTEHEMCLLINVKMPTISIYERENSILGLSEPKNRISWYFYTYEHLKISCWTELSKKKVL